jgi:hypothetical protein
MVRLNSPDGRLGCYPHNGRKIIDAIFSYTHRQTGVTEKYFIRVDVTKEFPFLGTQLPTYCRR